MAIPAVFATLAVLSGVVAGPVLQSHSLHQKRSIEDASWIKGQVVDSESVMPMRIALTQSNLHRGHEFMMDVADPTSANFGKHWTEAEVNEIFAPSTDAVKTVVDWLVESGIDRERISLSDNSGWLAFDASAHEAEGLFSTKFYEGQDAYKGGHSIACDEYYLPHHVREHVDYIKPGVMPAKIKKRTVSTNDWNPHPGWRPHGNHMPGHWPPPPGPWDWQHHPHGNVSTCGTWITTPCIRALYDVPPPSANPNPQNSLGIFEEGDYYAQGDLNDYFTTFAPHIPNGTHPIPNLIDGAVAPVPLKDAGGEAELDITVAYSLIYPQTITLYQTDDPVYAAEALNGTIDGFFDTFLDGIDGSFCTYSAFGQTGNNNTLDPVYPDPQPGGYKGQLQCGKYKPTNVISLSYLYTEAGLPVNYQRRQCNEWMKLALQGHTILFASGDYGVASFPDNKYPNGTCLGEKANIFSPNGPSTCPWVTSVGATQIPVNGTVNEPEEAADALFGDGALFTSSGGFSNIFGIPEYQKQAVARYFEVQNPPYPYYETLLAEDVGKNGGVYNRIGRGFPDISAVGRWWLDFVAGDEGGWGGTSMATPIVASLINMIVEERLKIGKGPIGFLNTHLYANPQLMHDITKGNSFGCGTTQGFKTAPGWDPVTGMGTPNYPAMLEYFLHLP